MVACASLKWRVRNAYGVSTDKRANHGVFGPTKDLRDIPGTLEDGTGYSLDTFIPG